MGGKNQDATTTIRYAPYIENHHIAFLDVVAAKRAAVIDASPFADIDAIPIDTAFFGLGFVLSDFPSLYDMYGKFMAGLDIEVLYGQIFEDTVDGPHVNALVSAEAALMDDDLTTTALPRFQVGMRDINSVVSSSYVIGKAMLEDARVKALAKFSGELKYRLIPVATERWTKHLDWNKAVVLTYGEIIKLYFSAKMDIDSHDQEVAVKNALWPFTVLEYERAALGALQGAVTSTSSPAGSSKAAKAIAGAMGGAAMGGMLAGASGGAVGGPMGMIMGGLLGLAGSFI